VRWTLAERTGWTLEYIDALPLDTVHEAMSVWSWINKGQADNARRK